MLLAAHRVEAQSPQEPDTLSITPEMVASGRGLFHNKGTCFACHGPNLEGSQVGPTLVKKTWKDAKGGDLKAIFTVISRGVPGTVMVAYPGGISRTDALSVAAYIWSINNRKEKP